MEWKLSRGQSRPLLKRLKENNTESSVKAISKRAFTHADQGQTADAFKTLCELSYVSTPGSLVVSRLILACMHIGGSSHCQCHLGAALP
jgi:hypothetical protein